VREPKVLFGVELKSIEALYATGCGFYVPPYQRPYSWGNDQVDRLIEDLSSGLRAWLDSEDTVTFLGSIILLKDDLFDQVEPAIKEHLPREVMVIIDGQQRLSTLAILGTLLHEELAIRGSRVMKKPFVGSAWFENRYKQTEFRLRPLFELNVGVGESPFYPKLIRAYDDQWSHDPNLAVYDSPIGTYLSQYVQCAHAEKRAKFKPQLSESGGKVIESIVRRLRRHLKQLISGQDSEGEPIFGIREHFPEATQRHVFKDAIPRELLTHILSEEGNEAKEVLNLVALCNYFLTRCSVTLTIPMEDQFAFELFERLNTTGQQLTAYETFKPLVVKAETLPEYRNSESHDSIEAIDQFVPDDLPYEKRARATHDVLIPFAMSEKGDRLPKKLGQQRNWLRKTFESLDDLPQKRRFVRELKNLVLFLKNCFRYGKGDLFDSSELHGISVNDPELTMICLDFIRKAKNEICIGPLSRFYSAFLENPTDASAMHLEDAIKASAAFFALYRWAFGTSGLPEAYQKLMRFGDGEGIAPLGRLVDRSQLPTGSEFGCYLGQYLCNKLGGQKDEWLKKVKSRATTTNSALSKFTLFAAYSHTKLDSGSEFCLPLKDSSADSLLKLETWCAPIEITSIAPKSRSTDWSDDLYDGETVGQIGNLLLLPKEISKNSNSQSWQQKRAYFDAISSVEKFSSHLDAGRVDLSGITPMTLEELQGSQFKDIISWFAQSSCDWTSEVVQVRSDRLSQLVWEELSPWIGQE
jgi:hypothetical protein